MERYSERYVKSLSPKGMAEYLQDNVIKLMFLMTKQKSTKQQAKRRINIIKGQLDGLFKMIENDEYCVDLLNQSLSIQNSIKSLDSLLLERHLRIHVADQFKTQKESAIRELLKVFKRSRSKT